MFARSSIIRKSHGFTLLEVLVSTAIIAVLTVAVFSSLGVAFNARRSAAKNNEPYKKLQQALVMMREDLQSTLPVTGLMVEETIGTDDEDDEGQPMDSFRFFSTVTPTPWEDHPIGLRRIDFELIEDEDISATDLHPGKILVRSVVRNTFAPVEPEPKRDVLCRDVRALNLRYFDGAGWVDEWDSETQDNLLPKAVEIYLELMPEDQDLEEDPEALGPYLTMIVNLPASVPEQLDTEGGGGTIRLN